jgi:hypothetical protein
MNRRGVCQRNRGISLAKNGYNRGTSNPRSENLMTRIGQTSLLMGAAVLASALGSLGSAQPPKTKGEVNTPPAKGERKQDTLRQGDDAPDFTLPRLKEKGEVKLSSYRGKKPVVLVFGSYT